MGISAAIGSIGGGILSGILGSQATSSAADAQQQAANNALMLQQQMWKQGQKNLQPYMTGGNNALATLSQLYGLGGTPDAATAAKLRDYLTSLPGYQFTLGQGIQGIDRSAASKGTLQSGGTMKDAMAYATGLADSTYQNYINQLYGLAGLGQASAAGQAANSVNASGNMANALLAAGQANAAGTIGGANAWAGGIGSGINNALTLYAMNPSAFKF